MFEETFLNAAQTLTYLFLSFISLIMFLGAAWARRKPRLFGRSQKAVKKRRIGALFAHAHYVVGHT
jgi:hypothetical protein